VSEEHTAWRVTIAGERVIVALHPDDGDPFDLVFDADGAEDLGWKVLGAAMELTRRLATAKVDA
jgi:hypothetical protein